jgi:hypothetical protein
VRRATIAVMVIVFTLSFATAILVSTAGAKPPIPCTYRCIDGLGYRCCIVDGEEVCEYDPKIDCIRW